MTKEIIDTTNKLVKPEDISPSDDEVIRQLSENLQDVTHDDINTMCDEIDEGKEEKKKVVEDEMMNNIKKNDSMRGKKEMIFEDLRKNHLTIVDNTKLLGGGKELHLELPAIGNFEGFKFDCFISNNRHRFHKKLSEKEDLILSKSAYSINEIGKLLESLNKYLKELGFETDGNIDYENELQSSLNHDEYVTYNALYCLKEITGLSDLYRLVEKTSRGVVNSVKLLDFEKHDCCFYWKILLDDDACFLLKLPG